MEKLLAEGASIIIRPQGSDGCRFLMAKYAVAIEYAGIRNGMIGDDLEKLFARGLEWVKEVQFCKGSQWTLEQVKQMEAARS